MVSPVPVRDSIHGLISDGILIPTRVPTIG